MGPRGLNSQPLCLCSSPSLLEFQIYSLSASLPNCRAIPLPHHAQRSLRASPALPGLVPWHFVRARGSSFLACDSPFVVPSTLSTPAWTPQDPNIPLPPHPPCLFPMCGMGQECKGIAGGLGLPTMADTSQGAVSGPVFAGRDREPRLRWRPGPGSAAAAI